jgi:membrane-associated phospholipid phosphatase
MTATSGDSRAPAARGGYVVANLAAGLAIARRLPRGAVRSRLVPAWRRYAAYLPVIAAFIAATMLWVDVPVMHAADELPPGFRAVVNQLTDFGRGVWPLTPLVVMLVAGTVLLLPSLSFMTRGALTAAIIKVGYMFVAIGLTGLADTIIKRIIGRVRPSDLGAFAYEPLSWRSEYASFPSGHAANAFATLVAVGLIFPRARPFLWVYALLIAASRVIVSSHFSSDVIGGAVFGAFGAIVIRDWCAVRRLGFYVGSDGRVHPMPGPSFRRIKKVARALAGQ